MDKEIKIIWAGELSSHVSQRTKKNHSGGKMGQVCSKKEGNEQKSRFKVAGT